MAKKPQPVAAAGSKSKKSNKDKAAAKRPAGMAIAENRRARHKYEIQEAIECGLMLMGTEVKSLRNGKCSIDEAYGRYRNGDLWLVGCDIPHLQHAAYWNHDPQRPRKLLLHKSELNRLIGKLQQRGLTLIPLRLYFNERGLAKCSLGLCRGLKTFDKRQIKKKAEAQREIQRAIRRPRN
jgi:SsrA-binding protein